MLVFLPGEREIREAAEALLQSTIPPAHEILPLFARLGRGADAHLRRTAATRRAGDQRRRNLADGAGHPLRGRYRPGAVKRYRIATRSSSCRSKRSRRAPPTSAPGAAAASPPASASASTTRIFARRGRRSPIRKSCAFSLAGVILRMKSLHLGDIEDFPVPRGAGRRMIADGYQLLQELNAR